MTLPTHRLARLMVCLCGVFHLCLGSLLLAYPMTATVPSLTLLTRFAPNTADTAALLVAVGAAAIIGYVSGIRLGLPALAVLLPQQMLLTASALGAVEAIARGRYPDGTVRAWQYIAAAQMPIIVLAVTQTLALLSVYGVPPWKSSQSSL